jgi:uncharacterized protein
MRFVAELAKAAVVCYLAILAVLYVFQRYLLYVPDRSRPELGALAQLGVREVQLTTADGLSLLAWYLPPREGRPVIDYFHGNAGSIAGRADRLRRFGAHGYGVLMPEYRGYSGNPGKPTETGLFADGAASLQFLHQQGVAASRVVLYGESLGTGIAVHLAAAQPVGAVILDSPYTSVPAAAQYHYPFAPARLMVWDQFDSLAAIPRVQAPILILAGGQDTIIPPELSRELFDAAPQPKQMFLIPEASHVNLDGRGGPEATFAFLEQHLPK